MSPAVRCRRFRLRTSRALKALSHCAENHKGAYLIQVRAVEAFVVEDRTRGLHLVYPGSGRGPEAGFAPRYSRPVLLGLRTIRKTLDESNILPLESRRELAKALQLTASYLELQAQIDELDECQVASGD